MGCRSALRAAADARSGMSTATGSLQHVRRTFEHDEQVCTRESNSPDTPRT